MTTSAEYFPKFPLVEKKNNNRAESCTRGFIISVEVRTQRRRMLPRITFRWRQKFGMTVTRLASRRHAARLGAASHY